MRIPHPYSLELAIKFIRETQVYARKKKEYVFGIVPKGIGNVVGCVGLNEVDWQNRNAELGYWMGKAYWGKRYTTEAAKLMLQLAFDELKFHRVYANLFAENTVSKWVLEKCGFIQEGQKREERFRFNQWHDVLSYSILEQEWRETKENKYPES